MTLPKRVGFVIHSIFEQKIIGQDDGYIEFRKNYYRLKLAYTEEVEEDGIKKTVRRSWTSVMDKISLRGYDVTRVPKEKMWRVDFNGLAGSAIITIYFINEKLAKEMAAEVHEYLYGEAYSDIEEAMLIA